MIGNCLIQLSIVGSRRLPFQVSLLELKMQILQEVKVKILFLLNQSNRISYLCWLSNMMVPILWARSPICFFGCLLLSTSLTIYHSSRYMINKSDHLSWQYQTILDSPEGVKGLIGTHSTLVVMIGRIWALFPTKVVLVYPCWLYIGVLSCNWIFSLCSPPNFKK